eukprot:7813873-Pyramimonas_sp.AAC.1
MGRPCTLTHWNIHNHGLDYGLQRRAQATISADLPEAKRDPVKAAVLVVGDFNFGDRLEHCHFGDDAPPRS